MNWLADVLGQRKPIIGMVHLPPLPGSANYDELSGIDFILDRARRDLNALQQGGIHAVMFCNENDRPYSLNADVAAVATMAEVIGQLKAEITVPFGVDVLWDPKSAIALATATGAAFVREIFTGAYESDMGIWAPNVGDVARYRRLLGAKNCRLLYNIQAEFASPLGQRSVAEVAASVAMSGLPDAICVSGKRTGQEVPLEVIQSVKEVLGDIPLFANTGVNAGNIQAMLSIADGVIVGTSLKHEGITWNAVDPARVKTLIGAAQATV